MATISIKQLAVYAVDKIEAGVSTADVSQKLGGFLLVERRSREAPLLFRAIEKELHVRGSTQVVITSAYAVTDEVKQRLATLLSVDKPLFDEVIDPSVIGGVKARAGEAEVDLTVRSRLNRFKSKVARG